MGPQCHVKEERHMANLTTKELAGLSDQLDFEKVLCCKYRSAEAACTDPELKTCFRQYAEEHKRNYESLLGFLK